MKARRLLIAAIWPNLLVVTAAAETLVVRPDHCAAPADAPRIISLPDVEVVDLNPDRTKGRILVIYPVATDGWASARILARFEIEGDSRRARLQRRCRALR